VTTWYHGYRNGLYKTYVLRFCSFYKKKLKTSKVLIFRKKIFESRF